MTKIYTRSGDDGETDLLGGARVSKASARIDVNGNVDELNSAIGLARSHTSDRGCDQPLGRIQGQLSDICAEVASLPQASSARGLHALSDGQIDWLEQTIDALQKDLPPLKSFVLPGGVAEAAQLQFARAVCRRVERKLIGLAAIESVRPELIRYFNRLSDLLFVMARHANHRAGIEEPLWRSRKS